MRVWDVSLQLSEWRYKLGCHSTLSTAIALLSDTQRISSGPCWEQSIVVSWRWVVFFHIPCKTHPAAGLYSGSGNEIQQLQDCKYCRNSGLRNLVLGSSAQHNPPRSSASGLNPLPQALAVVYFQYLVCFISLPTSMFIRPFTYRTENHLVDQRNPNITPCVSPLLWYRFILADLINTTLLSCSLWLWVTY